MKKILIFKDERNLNAEKYAHIASDYLYSHCKIENIVVSPENPFPSFKDENEVPDAIISFGGDGTILSAARTYIFYNIPIMGFNLGKLGFLAEFSTKYLKENIYNLLQGNYKTISRFVLCINLDNREILVINDFVFRNINHSKLITLSAYLDEQYIGDYRADGLIISTPTGSTAYSMACGGSIIHPDACVYCITPIAPHTLSLRPLIVPANKNISIQISPNNTDEQASIIADGNYIGEIEYDEIIRISVYDRKAHFIVPNDSNYFDILRQKLHWAEQLGTHTAEAVGEK
jgi:NAD+ kinase